VGAVLAVEAVSAAAVSAAPAEVVEDAAADQSGQTGSPSKELVPTHVCLKCPDPSFMSPQRCGENPLRPASPATVKV
jgi:hypothetical protein